MAKLNNEIMIQKMCESEPGLTKAAAKRLLKLFQTEIIDATVNGEGATFPGFGSFKAVNTAARIGHNPHTKETIEIKAGRRVKFTVGRNFKGSL